MLAFIMKSMEISLYSVEECEKIASDASLCYVQNFLSGITRKKHGQGFAYYYLDKTKVTDKNALKRIRNLAIPPAYTDVWICSFANGHIQATGRDNKNRKQYIYHPLWHEARQIQKFELMLDFGRTISLMREHINEVLSRPLSLSKVQIICAILYLLDKSCVRVGNAIYAKTNKTFGLTTLRKKHLSINRNKASLNFKGKNSKNWHIALNNKKIIKILKKCEEIPGYELFKYQSENNGPTIITSQDINYYLKSLTSHPFTAKDFRTWIASRETFCQIIKYNELEEKEPFDFLLLLKKIANLLGHTPGICQKNYIHPEIVIWWKKKKLEEWKTKNKRKINSLDNDQLFLFWLEEISL